MTINGRYKFKESNSTLWKMLNDPNVLARITPGIKSLESIGPDQYTAISEVKIGPVQGSFTGTLSLKDKIENTSTIVELNQKSKMGNVHAEITIQQQQATDSRCRVGIGPC